VGKENYSYKKYQRELEKKKAEEKKLRKQERKNVQAVSESGQAPASLDLSAQ
jgi:hypothetical protein